jgi:mRNA interferase RelE/StbE
MWIVLLMPSSKRDIRRIDRQHIPRIYKQINDLQADPLPSGHLKVMGAPGLVRLRVGDYRIFYTVNTARQQIIVYHIYKKGDSTYKRLRR